MKKIFKITGIIILVIVLALAALPFAFKGQMQALLKAELNKSLKAQIDFERLGMNFFRRFPHATISLDNLSVAGVGEFSGDTLLAAGKASVTVNLLSLFGDAGYEIISISLDRARLHAIVRENGQANWDVVPAAEESDPAEPAAPADDSSSFKLLLRQLRITNAYIYYDDEEGHRNAALENLHLTLSGDMTASETRIRAQLRIDALSLRMANIPCLSRATVNGDVDIDADLRHNKYTLARNRIQINELSVGVDGWIALLDGDDGLDMDLRLQTPTMQFKDVLSLIPTIYSTRFNDLQTSGAVSLNASAKGAMKGDLLPAFDVRLAIADATFQYPGMPESVTRIHADIHAYNRGGTADNTVVDISKFHFEMGGNPFDLKFRIGTPASDPDVALTAAGKVNLSLVEKMYPLENTRLGGRLDVNLELATRLSTIEKGAYEQVHASGLLRIDDLWLKSEGVPNVRLEKVVLAFSPQYVDLTEFAAQIGRNDLSGSGKLEHFIPYFLRDKTLKGTLAIRSEYLNLNDFMSGDDDDAQAADDSSSIETVKLPRNIAFDMDGTFRRVIFDKLEMEHVAGRLRLREGKLDMQNLSLNALGGKLRLNGYYDSSRDDRPEEINVALDVERGSFAKTFETFVSVRQLAPIFENMTGDYSATLQLSSPLGAGFTPVLPALKADGVLQSSEVTIARSPVLDGLAQALQNESLKELKIKDLKLPFAIDDGRVASSPFAVNFGEGVMNLSGSTGLDQSIDYTAHIHLTGKLANNYVNDLTVKIGGSFTRPTFSVDAKKAVDQALGALAGSIMGAETGAPVSEQINEELDRQADHIRKQAKEAGEKLIAEAEKQGQKLVDEANKTANAIVKIAAVKAAEAAAKKLQDEARKQAEQLNEEAEKQIEALKSKLRAE